ncbi:MAG: CBS domain-containing protein [Methanobacteriaceae archaeon]
MPTVGNVMTPDPVSVSPETPATHVRSIFRDEDFRSIPVISKNRLEGVITRADMLNISSTKSNIDAHGIMEHAKVIATPDLPIRELARNILDAGQVYAPVVESAENMKLVGIITVADILGNFFSKGVNPLKETIEDIFTQDVITCHPHDLISHVWNRMDDTGFSGLPVLKKNKLVGIITRKDIIDAGNIRINRESGDIRRSTMVEKVMRTPPLVVTPQTLTNKTVQIMLEFNVGRLPVVENPIYIKKEPQRAKESDLIGIVSREDILWSYIG